MKVYRDTYLRMSSNSMANFMYAVIMTKCSIPTSFGVGIYGYDRKQNAYNNVQVKVEIEEDQIEKFESISGVKLTAPISVHVNGTPNTEGYDLWVSGLNKGIQIKEVPVWGR